MDDGCGMVLKRRTSVGSHCQLCKKLKVPRLSEDIKADIKVATSLLSMSMASLNLNQVQMVQCSKCGLCGTTIWDPCGTCKCLGKNVTCFHSQITEIMACQLTKIMALSAESPSIQKCMMSSDRRPT